MLEFPQFCQSMHDAPEVNLGLLTQCTVKPIYWHRSVAKKTTVFIGFPRRIFKDSEREGHKVVLCLCTILWMIDSKVTGWHFRSQHHQRSGSNWSGVYILSSVQFSHSVMTDSLRPHEPQHTKPPCLSPTPGVHPNPCPLNQWCHPTTSSSVIHFSSCPQSFPASGSFPMSQLFASGGRSIGVQLQHQSLQWTPRTDLL